MPLIPALRKQRQVDCYEFEVSLVYRVSSKTDSQGYTEKSCLGKNSHPTSHPTIPHLQHAHEHEIKDPESLGSLNILLYKVTVAKLDLGSQDKR